MLDLGRSITVNAGTVLMVKTPASEGKPGKKITGEIINQKVGVDKAFLVQKNVEIDPNNPLHLIASIHGIPILVKGFIKVDDVLLLESVSHKTGNIIYDGTIVITSDINESMKVNASGDITVMGLIESAKVSCGGDLTVSQPIIGHQKKSDGEFSCEIKCGGNLTGTIAQYAKLRVAKNITLTNQLIHCDTKCKGTIIVHDKNQLKGSVIGGMTEVANGLITTVTGTNGGTKTTITLLSNITELTELKLKYIHDIQSVDETINKFKAHEDKIDRLPEKATNKNVKKLLAFEKQQYRKESDRLQQLLLETKSQLKHSYSRVSLTATSSLHSGTTVNFERQSWVSDKEYGPSWLSLINNSLQITPYEKQEQA